MIIILNDGYTYSLIEEVAGEHFRTSRIYYNKDIGYWELFQYNCDGSSIVTLFEEEVRQYLRDWAKYPRIRFQNRVEYCSTN